MLDIQSFPSFDLAARAVLEFLHERLGFDLWMVTRTEGDDWIVLQAEDHGYGVKEGAKFRWADSFCSRMVEGKGPRIAPRSALVPAYVAAPIASQMTIGAYVGVPLSRNDGSLFGTLCAVHPAPQPAAVSTELPLVEILAQLLCSFLAAELRAVEHLRRAERAQAEALTDPLTGLFNRRGWDQLLAAEESRCRRYGNPACVLSIDLDGLKSINDSRGHAHGDELLRRTGQAIQEAVREQDVAARLGGDEFAILGIECDPAGARSLSQRVEAALATAGVSASLGLALRDPLSGLEQTVVDSDQAMYADKRSRRSAPSSLAGILEPVAG